jgi:DNA-binding response OmpR family regulator
VSALDSGANDYVTKPFSFDELAARVRAHLRSPEQGRATELAVASIRLDFLTRRVERAGMPITLSAREFDLLAYFMRHPGQVLSKQQILSAVWGYDFDPGTNVVEVYVGYLRRKLAAYGGPAPIETLRSVGYRLVDRE